MPFKSGKQRRYLWANEPEIAREWTDRYGARGGGIMHQFENYAHDDGNNVSVPRSFQARPNTEQVNLAYITPEEEGILQMLKPDTPHIGPMNVPNYDARDARGNFATSGQHDAPTAGDVAAGVGSTTGGGAGDTRIGTIKQDIQKVNRGIRPAGYNVNQFQNNNAVNRNRNRFSNIVGRLRGWNPITNDWNTQKQYEDARTHRRNTKRISNILGREAPWTEHTLKNLDKLGYKGDLSKSRLGTTRTTRAIQNDPDYLSDMDTGYARTHLQSLANKQALTNKLSAKDFINLDQSISASGYKPRSWMENLQSKYPGAKPAAAVKPDFLKQQSWYNSPLKLKTNLAGMVDPDVATFKSQIKGPLTISQYLSLSKQGLVPESQKERFEKQVLEAIKKSGGFGETFQKNWSTGVVEPTFEGGILDIDESKLQEKEAEKYLEVAEGGLASLWPR